jgi:hypothetical protein
MSDIESGAPTPSADVGALLGKLLSSPDLVKNLSSVLGASGTADPTASVSASASAENVGEGISRVLSNPEMMAKLPDVMKMLAPMMQQGSSSGASVPAVAAASHGGGERDRRGCRNDLLVALKPFLSPERCRAIDMLLGLSRLGDALQKML